MTNWVERLGRRDESQTDQAVPRSDAPTQQAASQRPRSYAPPRGGMAQHPSDYARATAEFRWREPESGLVHQVKAEVQEVVGHMALASSIQTLCGIKIVRVAQVEITDDALTCLLCIEGSDWLPKLFERLPSALVGAEPVTAKRSAQWSRLTDIRGSGTMPGWQGAGRGSTRAWRRIRAAVLARDPICTDCGAEPSTVADHIRAKSLGGSDSLSNLRGIGDRCDRRRSAQQGNAAMQARRNRRRSVEPHPGLTPPHGGPSHNDPAAPDTAVLPSSDRVRVPEAI